LKEPVWISDREAEALNFMVIDQFGGYAGGVRDENLFKGAMARSLNKWHYDEPKPDLFSLAAAYCFAICRGHVFHEGNKRTAYVVAITFLSRNGIECAPKQADIVTTILALAVDDISENDLAEWFKNNSV
jgi:death-on-curing protein